MYDLPKAVLNYRIVSEQTGKAIFKQESDNQMMMMMIIFN